MADWNSPVSTTAYLTLLQALKDRDLDAATQFYAAVPTNPATHMIRFVSANNRWERYNGTAWVELSTAYAIKLGSGSTINATPIGATTPSTGAFTTLTATTPATGDSSTNVATTAFVNAEIANDAVTKTAATGAASLPSGTTAQRPGSPVLGQLRFNTTLAQFEGYNGSAWGKVGGGATGGGTNAVFYLNDQVVTTDYSVPSGQNAMTAGPVTVQAGVTVTVPAGSTWSVVSGGQTAASNPSAVVTNATLYEAIRTIPARNRIINGRMRVDQRNVGSVQTFTAGGALAYCVDRFYAYCTGANITGRRTELSNSQRRYRFTGATGNTGVGFGQRIESLNSLDLAGQVATLQAKLSSTSITTVSWAAYYANTVDSFGTLASPTRTLIASGSFTINATEATYSAQISVPAAATTGIEIVLTAGALLASQTLTIGDVQFEQGSVAMPIEVCLHAQDLALCQRYYIEGRYNFTAYTTAGSGFTSAHAFPVTMRTQPTMATKNVASSNASSLYLTAYDDAQSFVNSATAVSTGVVVHSGIYIASAEL